LRYSREQPAWFSRRGVQKSSGGCDREADHGAYRIEGRVIWADDGTPVVGVSLGLGGIESRTDAQGRFVMAVKAKK
jgi:hypothetical protein